MARSVAAPMPAALLALVLLSPVLAGGQVVLRWDGSDAAPPPATEGVQVTRLAWSAASAETGGSRHQLTVGGSIAALGLDPQADLAALAPSWGGIAWNNQQDLFDGDPATSWRDPGYTCSSILSGCDDIYASPGTYEIDLGARFYIDRVVIHSGLNDPAGIVRDFRVHLAADLPKQLWCCGPMHPVAAEIRDNREPVREVVLASQQRSRFLQIAVGEREEGWEIHDIQIFGRGFVEDAAYVSDVIPLERPMAWGDLRWSGSQEAGASVLIRTRTGTDADPERYWRFTGLADQKEEVSRSRYEGLSLGERAGTSYDRAHWSLWSAPYDFADSSGTPVLSPGPRAYVQLRIDFVPSALAGGRVDFVELRAATPAATELIGEVWPVEAEIGEWQRFTYFVFASIEDDDTGFDRLEIRSLSQLGAVVDARIGDRTVPFEVQEADPHRFVVSLPRMRPDDSGAIVELSFEARVLRYGASFDGRVWDSALALAPPQSINAGDATSEYDGNRATVTTRVRNDLLLQVHVSPAVITPNGDGANDALSLAYEILDLTGPAAVSVDVLDLAGRRIRRLHDGPVEIGLYTQVWDGRDDAGRRVAPGIYLGRVSLDTDERNDQRLEVLHVLY